jgi:hypothetical protein
VRSNGTGGCVAELPRHHDRDTGNGIAPIAGLGGEVGDSVDTCMDVHVTFAVLPRHAFRTADGSRNVFAVLVIRFTTGVIGRHDDGYGLVTARKPHILGREKSVAGGDQHGRERDPAQSWLPLDFDRRRTARLQKAYVG